MVKVILLLIICLALLFPLWLMVMNSFTPAKVFLRMPPRLIPYSFTLQNYKAIFALPSIGLWLLNSIIVVSGVIVLGVLVNGAAGYVFAFAKGFTILFWIMLSPIFVTRIIIIIAQFVVVGKLGIRGIVAVIGMTVFWPTGIYIFKTYFHSIPSSLMESARIDGAPEHAILARVVLPLAKPVVGASIIFLGMAALGDFVWQYLNLQLEQSRTLVAGLVQTTFDTYTVKNIGYDLAVGTVLFIPYLLLFVFSGKYFIKGLNMGGVKE